MVKKIPYFKISQLSSEYLVTKMNAKYLIEHVDFEFRFPYRNSRKDIQDAFKYIRDLEKKTGVIAEERERGIQRRTNLSRINSIADFIHENVDKKSLLFTTPLVLGVNLYDDEDGTKLVSEKIEENNLELDEKVRFTIVDGQHRLLGIARYFEKYHISDVDIEIPVMLLPDSDLPQATRVFIDINANQRKVNKSIVYDLYSNIDEEEYAPLNRIKSVVQALNENKTSSLYNQIKMLGTGEGSISLAFMIDYIKGEIIKRNDDFDSNRFLRSLNRYLSAFKAQFDEQVWRGVFLKTTGMGALLLCFMDFADGDIYHYEERDSDLQLQTNLLEISAADLEVQGTGKKAQEILKNRLLKVIK